MRNLKDHAHKGYIIVAKKTAPLEVDIFLIVDGAGDVQGIALTQDKAIAEIGRLGISAVELEAKVIPKSLLVYADGDFFIVAKFDGATRTFSFLVCKKDGVCIETCGSLKEARGRIASDKQIKTEATGKFTASLGSKPEAKTTQISTGMRLK